MAHTYTRTWTYVFIIGSELAASDEKLAQAAAKMKEVATKYTEDMERHALGYEETNDVDQLGLMRFQWSEVMRKFATPDELADIQALLGRD
jgi:hypothetical protein